MKNIIVPTDFSDNAYNALYYATQLVNHGVCKILLVHSYEKELANELSMMDPTKNEQIVLNLRKRIQVKMEAVKHQIIRDCDTQEIRVELFYGGDALNDMVYGIIKNLDVNSIVMGTKGSSGLKEVFLGSQAVSVVKHIQSTPVFLIPKETDFEAPKNIAYTTDFTKDYQTSHFSYLKNLIKEHQSQLDVCHVYDTSKDETGLKPHFNDLQNKLSDVPFNMRWIPGHNGLEKDISQFCSEHDIHLLVLTYHKYGFFKGLLKTSLVEKASFHLDLPLLILPEEL